MKNRIFTDKRPDLSNAEIDGFKNFDGVLDKVGQAPPSNPGPENTPKFDFKNFFIIIFYDKSRIRNLL